MWFMNTHGPYREQRSWRCMWLTPPYPAWTLESCRTSLFHGSASTDHTSPAITDTHKHHTSGSIRAQKTGERRPAEAEADPRVSGRWGHHAPQTGQNYGWTSGSNNTHGSHTVNTHSHTLSTEGWMSNGRQVWGWDALAWPIWVSVNTAVPPQQRTGTICALF